jgi:hypothetical protein
LKFKITIFAKFSIELNLKQKKIKNAAAHFFKNSIPQIFAAHNLPLIMRDITHQTLPIIKKDAM